MTLLPTLLDENRAINQAAFWILMARHNMEKEYSREWLETELRKGLREGRLAQLNEFLGRIASRRRT